MQKLWELMADKLLEAISVEVDTEIVGIMMDSLCKVHISLVSSVLQCSYCILVSTPDFPNERRRAFPLSFGKSGDVTIIVCTCVVVVCLFLDTYNFAVYLPLCYIHYL